MNWNFASLGMKGCDIKDFIELRISGSLNISLKLGLGLKEADLFIELFRKMGECCAFV